MSNRLANERSPYLLQHNNPVDWYPWGDDAFAKARTEQKPIFLSIGYSTCHWCHVMEHESFEDASIADVLNRKFVAVKVDREERPDVDRVYDLCAGDHRRRRLADERVADARAAAVFGGTYSRRRPWGRPGFIDVLAEIGRAWKDEREKVMQSAETILDRLKAATTGGRVPNARP